MSILIDTNNEEDEKNAEPFTKEEDHIILKSFLQYGTNWGLVAKNLNQRRKNQIKNRYKEIKKSKFNLTIV